MHRQKLQQQHFYRPDDLLNAESTDKTIHQNQAEQ